MTNTIWKNEFMSEFFVTLKHCIVLCHQMCCFYRLMALRHVPNGQLNVNDGKFSDHLFMFFVEE